jgi:alpha-mannosidase
MNNYWWTNSPASQGGRHWFNYSITSYDGEFDPAYSNQFGWFTHFPLSAVVLGPKNSGPEPVLCRGMASGRFMDEMPENVVIAAMKAPEQGEGYVVRLVEIAGRGSTCRVRFPARRIKEAYMTTPVESPLPHRRSIPVSDGAANVRLSPWELVTLRLVFE